MHNKNMKCVRAAMLVAFLAFMTMSGTEASTEIETAVRDISRINTDSHIAQRRALCATYVAQSRSHRQSRNLSAVGMTAAARRAITGIRNIMRQAFADRGQGSRVARGLNNARADLQSLLEEVENGIEENLFDTLDNLVTFVIDNAAEAVELAGSLGWDFARVVELLGMLVDEGAAIAELLAFLAALLA